MAHLPEERWVYLYTRNEGCWIYVCGDHKQQAQDTTGPAEQGIHQQQLSENLAEPQLYVPPPPPSDPLGLETVPVCVNTSPSPAIQSTNIIDNNDDTLQEVADTIESMIVQLDNPPDPSNNDNITRGPSPFSIVKEDIRRMASPVFVMPDHIPTTNTPSTPSDTGNKTTPTSEPTSKTDINNPIDTSTTPTSYSKPLPIFKPVSLKRQQNPTYTSQQ